MLKHLASVLLVSCVFISFSSQAAKVSKVKKQSARIEEPSVVKQAQDAIAVDSKVKVPHATSPQDTGILVLRAPDLNDDRYPTRYPVGLHVDSYALSGTSVSDNNSTYDFSKEGSALVPSLKLGMVPWSPIVFESYALKLGYQQKQISAANAGSLSLAHYLASVSAENKFYTRGRLDFRYQIEAGLAQSQISSKENSLSNVVGKASFIGLGVLTQYHLQESLSADLGLTYRSVVAKSEGYNIQPIGIGAGISYIW